MTSVGSRGRFQVVQHPTTTTTPTTPAPTTAASPTSSPAPAPVNTAARALQTFAGEPVDLIPHHHKPASQRVSVFALQVAQKSRSPRAWNPVALLPSSLQARLGPADCDKIQDAVRTIQREVQTRGLSYVPVFGYLSLRTNNFKELGKASQADVGAADVVSATLTGHDIDVVASTVFRGTPEHPGAVAGLRERAGSQTPGAMLKVPLARAEELLAVLLARELFAEGDLHDGVDGRGEVVSNAMYAPAVKNIHVDGEDIPAFMFVTNTDGAKAVSRPGAFGDDLGLTVERMAWLFAGQGGFVGEGGAVQGGRSLDYWEVSYAAARKLAGEPIDPTIAEAIDRAKLLPQAHVVAALMARTDDDAALMVKALAVLFSGAVSPVTLQQAQKSDHDLVRTNAAFANAPDDVVARLLEKARAMAAAGLLPAD